MTGLDRFLWPILKVGDAVYVMILIALPILQSVLCLVIAEREIVLLTAVGIAFITFMLCESRLRLRVWQATCDQAYIERRQRASVDLRVERSKPSDWDDA